MKPWHGSCIGAFLVFLIGGLCLLSGAPFMGGMAFAMMPSVFDKLTALYLCPTATDYAYKNFDDGTPGHYTELTCTYADGSHEVFTKGQVAIKGYGASIFAFSICGGIVLLFLMIVAALLGARLVKRKTAGCLT